MEIVILIAFLAVAAVCFVFIARPDKSDIYAEIISLLKQKSIAKL